MYKPYELQNFAIRFFHKIILTYFNDNSKGFKRAFKFYVLLNRIHRSSERSFNSYVIYCRYRVLLEIMMIGDVFPQNIYIGYRVNQGFDRNSITVAKYRNNEDNSETK